MLKFPAGIAQTRREEELLLLLAKTEMERLQGLQSLFIEHDDLVVENFVNGIANEHLQIVGSDLMLGKIYDKNWVSCQWFMHCTKLDFIGCFVNNYTRKLF